MWGLPGPGAGLAGLPGAGRLGLGPPSLPAAAAALAAVVEAVRPARLGARRRSPPAPLHRSELRFVEGWGGNCRSPPPAPPPHLLLARGRLSAPSDFILFFLKKGMGPPRACIRRRRLRWHPHVPALLEKKKQKKRPQRVFAQLSGTGGFCEPRQREIKLGKKKKKISALKGAREPRGSGGWGEVAGPERGEVGSGKCSGSARGMRGRGGFFPPPPAPQPPS